MIEIQDVVDGRSAEFVNALVVVADHHDVVFGIAEQLCELELCLVGVLILIHQNVAEFVAVFFQKLGILLEQLDREQNQIVKIEGIGHMLALLVLFVQAQNRAAAQVVRADRRFIILRKQQLFLGT